MLKNGVLSALLLLCAHCCYADYIGAVVEYNPSVVAATPYETMEENIKNYIFQIENAATLGVKIIVFPEYGITGLITELDGYGIEVPNVGTSNFTDSSYLLLKLSNAAKTNGLHVVVNILEQTNNTRNETFLYNTNLVFSDNGTLIAKYRKINLYLEPKLTPGTDVVTFTTDFGTFGLMTCADILYNNPAQTMLANTGVTDVIYPAAWTSYLPFYASLEVQVGYALANKVNLLAANINDPTNGLGGSGIFRSDGTVLRTVLTDRPATSFVHAMVLSPSSATRDFSLMGFDILYNTTRQELSNFKNLTDFQYDSYVYKPLDLSSENVTEDICDGKFCCTFNIIALKNETNSSETYKLMAFHGKAKFDTQNLPVKYCNLVACLTDDISTCGVRPPTSYTTRFSRILVWGNFEVQPDEFFRPTSLGVNLQPIYNVTYLENRNNQSYGISFNITQPATNVILFGLYGKGGAGTLSVSLVLVAFIVAFQRMF